MTREEAARVLKYLWIEQDENAKSMQQLTKRFFERQEALRIGVAALRSPTPDPETGLVPCGCGGKAQCCGNSGDYDSYSFECIKCETGTLSFNTKEDAKNAWNRAMGWLPPLLEANE